MLFVWAPLSLWEARDNANEALKYASGARNRTFVALRLSVEDSANGSLTLPAVGSNWH
jgi:hypothetical protein